MKTVVIGEGSSVTMEKIIEVYPRHKIVADKYINKGDVIGIGAFSDRGNMAIFKLVQQLNNLWLKIRHYF